MHAYRHDVQNYLFYFVNFIIILIQIFNVA